MPLNRRFVGRTTRSTEAFEVTRGDIRRFAAAIGEPNPAYLDRAAAQALGYPDVVAPPTFLITRGSGGTGPGLLSDPELGLDFSRVVHGAQEFLLHRAICAGDRLDAETRLSAIRDAGANELLTLVTELTRAGERVATLTNTIVSRGTAQTP